MCFDAGTRGYAAPVSCGPNLDIQPQNAPAAADARGSPVRRSRSPQTPYNVRLEGQIYEPGLATERRFAAEVAMGQHTGGPDVDHLQEVLQRLTALVDRMADGQDPWTESAAATETSGHRQ